MRLLGRDIRETWTIPQLVKATDKTPGAVRVALHRLYRSGRVARIDRGLYVHPSGLVRRELPDPRLRVHNIQVEARCNKLKGWPYRDMVQFVTQRFPHPASGVHPRSKAHFTYAQWADRSVSIQAYPDETGLLQVFCACSEDPMHFAELFSFIHGWLPGAFGIPLGNWTVKQCDWNIDVRGRIVAGVDVSGMPVDQFGRIMLKVYQKTEELARAEARTMHPIRAEVLAGYLADILRTIEDVTLQSQE